MQQRLSYIDGLRAIAVLSVVAEHVGIYLFGASTVPGQVLRSGMHGVDLFFVISGFCLSYPLLASVSENGAARFDIVRYIAHRVVRILPPYYIAIAVLAAGVLAVRGSLTWPDIGRQFLMLDAGSSGHLLNPSFWTLPLEFRWYAAFPFLLLLWLKAPRAFFLLAGLCMMSAATKLTADDILILPTFMLGIVAADLFIRRTQCAAAMLVAACLFAAVAVVRTPANWLYVIHPAWQAAAFCFVAGCGSSPLMRTMLSARGLRWIGTASYSIYLIHYPIVNFLVQRGVNAVAAGALGIGAGMLFWRIAEVPFTGRSRVRRLLVERMMAFAGKSLHFLQMPPGVQIERRACDVQTAAAAAQRVPIVEPSVAPLVRTHG